MREVKAPNLRGEVGNLISVYDAKFIIPISKHFFVNTLPS